MAFAVGMVAIGERLGVTLTEEELLSCETVGDLQAADSRSKTTRSLPPVRIAAVSAAASSLIAGFAEGHPLPLGW
ncbi:hypothetical protein MAHJHV60_45620 [Mycobacterium avium subsp. hominissuis]